MEAGLVQDPAAEAAVVAAREIASNAAMPMTAANLEQGVDSMSQTTATATIASPGGSAMGTAQTTTKGGPTEIGTDAVDFRVEACFNGAE